MRTMYDAAIARNIPPNAEMVAGYDDGRLYTWSAADWARFPNATLIHITATGETLTSDVADVEQGDLTPTNAADWIRRRLTAGIPGIPTLYYGLSNTAAIDAACEGLTFDRWVADWTGVEHMPDGAAVCQYAAKGIYDVSCCIDDWPRAQEQAPPTEPPPTEPTLADVLQALSYLKAETARVAAQYGAA